ncbi:MAG: glutamine--tRNA ligase/YqeY domain fusion protein [Gammaproteobacteria bacterium]|nr:glutamine--tRNA ligase/YqeY domain fusion protein [Gammaproteobacteria bacterium]
MVTMSDTPVSGSNFIRTMIAQDIENGKHGGRVGTRFPPEPNGYLHVGHTKSICLNFGIAEQFGGTCNLRFDDTNPEKESIEYINAIKRDVEWLGFQWNEEHYASDYFGQLYDYALELIDKGLAYVDSQSADDIRVNRGTLTEPGKPSPNRERSVEENRSLFEAMKAGKFADGEVVLRAKIDMGSPQMCMRDPVLYRVRHVHHHRTGDQWCIYPMYDFTHCISDAIEGITHSLCTLEFEDNRVLYDWILANISIPHKSEQTEFARLQLEYAMTSKRKLKTLVDEQIVAGWDDPRMPTVAGMRRKGYPPAAIRDFCERIGVTKKNAWISMGQLEFSVREALNDSAARRMAVLKPLKVKLTNLGKAIEIEQSNHPKDPEMGKRTLQLSDEIYIEQDDFALEPPPKFKRLIEGGEVRLRGAYVIRCDKVVTDNGVPVELECSVDLDTLGKNPEGRKVKGVIHWVDAKTGVAAEIREYGLLFNEANPAKVELEQAINPASLVIYQGFVEPAAAMATPETQFQFERTGYYVADQHDHQPEKPVFNLTVGLRDSFGI